MSGKGNLSNQSTAVAFSVLEYLVDRPAPQRLREIAQGLDMNASTASRYLAALQSCGYVAQDPVSSCYSVTTKLCELANTIMSHVAVSDIVHPYVQRVSEYFGETACFAIERNHAVFYVDIVVSSSRTLMNVQRIGISAPLHCTASGKLFLCNLSDGELENYFARFQPQRYTSNTIVTKEAMAEELRKIRAAGFAIDNGENEEGITCISSPIQNSAGKVIACISITGPSFRVTEELTEEKRNYLSAVAEDLRKIVPGALRFNI